MFETGLCSANVLVTRSIVENHLVHIRSKIPFTPKLIALRPKFESFGNFTSKLYVAHF